MSLRPPRRLATHEGATLVEHLGELRARVVVSLLAVAAAFTCTYAVHARLIAWLNSPLDPHRHPITLGVAEPFTTSVTVSLYAAVGLALPVVLWQLWSYLAPAFEERTQRTVAALVLFATVLLAAGIVFAYTVVLPAAVHFLTNFDSGLYDIQVRAKDYYSFVMLVLLGVGVVFELPIFIVSLVRLGVLTTAKLRRSRRIGIVAMTALAVALPGVDPVTTLFELVPLLLLFEGSIWLSVVLERRWTATRGRLATERG